MYCSGIVAMLVNQALRDFHRPRRHRLAVARHRSLAEQSPQSFNPTASPRAIVSPALPRARRQRQGQKHLPKGQPSDSNPRSRAMLKIWGWSSSPSTSSPQRDVGPAHKSTSLAPVPRAHQWQVVNGCRTRWTRERRKKDCAPNSHSLSIQGVEPEKLPTQRSSFGRRIRPTWKVVDANRTRAMLESVNSRLPRLGRRPAEHE
ncbi:hypothetical protein HIM_09913 [Hirsutella minnesotensis 3608]|uniref:Uncharacterized protein n=1 Tax=Hirsutella minnesotensis 3608 TaxID=1043627 RepID=A0A0F8A2T9_9HYPO|nr:hypothetical protein HIM_09913 [Hirsutella minnesotensis 3608]